MALVGSRTRGSVHLSEVPMGRSRAVGHRRVVEYVPAPTRRDLMRPFTDAGLTTVQAYSLLRMAAAIEALEADQ